MLFFPEDEYHLGKHYKLPFGNILQFFLKSGFEYTVFDILAISVIYFNG
jgi:hypothetical protein